MTRRAEAVGENTKISWCDHTFNPWVGCTKVSPACDGCYAEHMMATRLGRVAWGAPGQGTGTRERTSSANWAKPLAWDRKAARDGTRPFVFCASLADVFDNAAPAAWRRDLFDLIRATPHLTWLLLTKRPQNIAKLFSETITPELRKAWSVPALLGKSFWPPNAAIGCTVVTQAEADRDVQHLLHVRAALNPAFAFLSMEPLLGPVDLTRIRPRPGDEFSALRPSYIDWVITGGETDQGAHKARPSHPAWFRSLRDQCAEAGVPFHHKQNGEWAPDPELDRDFLSSNVGVPMGSVERLQSSTNSYAVAWERLDDDGVHARGVQLKRVGKRAAGHLLAGVAHDARPIP
jgi:protein gp37